MHPSNTVLRNDDPDGSDMTWLPLAQRVAEASDTPLPLLNVGVLRRVLSVQEHMQARVNAVNALVYWQTRSARRQIVFSCIYQIVMAHWPLLCPMLSCTNLGAAALGWVGNSHECVLRSKEEVASHQLLFQGRVSAAAAERRAIVCAGRQGQGEQCRRVRNCAAPCRTRDGVPLGLISLPKYLLHMWCCSAFLSPRCSDLSVSSLQVAAYAAARVASIGFEQVQDCCLIAGVVLLWITEKVLRRLFLCKPKYTESQRLKD